MPDERLIHLLTATEQEVEEVRDVIWDKIGKRPHPESSYLIAVIRRILEEHKQYGKLTVRQVYYQLVSRGTIENSPKSYKRYVNHCTTGRKGGVIPWDAFEDRTRTFHNEPVPESMYDIGLKEEKEAIKSWFKYVLNPKMSEYYELYKWENQPCFVELWVEKDALAGFLSPLCEGLGVGLVVSRGYTSYTFKQEAIQRFKERDEEQYPVLLYLGDLDPSGYDIYRCLKEEIQDEIDDARVDRIGLNVEDVSQFGLVANPIKDSDTRTKGFKGHYPELGDNVYELDALPPGELIDRARRNILKYFDADIDEENKRRVRHWRANFVDIQEKYRKELKKIGIDLGN
jgi:hypothetical protein